MPSNEINNALRDGIERRRFLRRAGLGAAGLATAAAGVTLPASRASAAAPAISDAEIFNFALNFEYLGAEYYLSALGMELPANLTSGAKQGSVIRSPLSSTTVPFQSSATGYFAQQLANDEFAHVTVIREAITAEGGSPIAEPTIDLYSSWTSLAVGAGLIASGQIFDPFESETNFLLGAYILEDVCVTALCGAASLINKPVNLSYAASILGVEGYQVGLIRSRLSAIGAGQVTDAISTFRASLSATIVPSSTPDDNGTAISGNEFNFTNVDINAQAFRRTPQQVLAIAYGGGTTNGGFFPSGVNGVINSTSGSTTGGSGT